MSFARSLAISLVSIIFILSFSLAVTWYNFRDVLNKDNIQGFVNREIVPELINDQCNQLCTQFNTTNCMELCISQASNETEINNMVSSALNSVYSTRIANFSIDDIVNYMNLMFLPLLVISIVSVVVMLLLTKSHSELLVIASFS